MPAKEKMATIGRNLGKAKGAAGQAIAKPFKQAHNAAKKFMEMPIKGKMATIGRNLGKAGLAYGAGELTSKAIEQNGGPKWAQNVSGLLMGQTVAHKLNGG